MSQQAQSLGIFPPVGMEALNVIFLILNAFSVSLTVPVRFVNQSLVMSLEKVRFCIIHLNRSMPKTCGVRFALGFGLFWDFILGFFASFWNTSISPASKEANIFSTLELCSLHFCFYAGSHIWLSVAAGELNFRDAPGLANR